MGKDAGIAWTISLVILSSICIALAIDLIRNPRQKHPSPHLKYTGIPMGLLGLFGAIYIFIHVVL